ncbi:SMI1/KNR4 family protein [Flavobacterium chungangense]|nr:SMI1/KNR4 family protein [Flavobacterium chungangense]
MMEKLLTTISEKAIKNEDFNFTSEQIENNWLGTIPATEKQISNTENRLGIKLPKDYIEFIKITNGFSAPNDIEPSFENISNIDFLKNIEPFTIEAYSYLPELKNAILIAGIEEEQYFLLIPPESENEEWKYWKFANWYPGEHPFGNLNEYFKDVLEFIVKEHES